MGPDGHTCSLFPSHPLLDEKTRWVTYLTDSPKPPPVRITLTYPAIASARNVVSLGYGFDSNTLKRVLEEEDAETGLPMARIKSSGGSPVVWFVGEESVSSRTLFSSRMGCSGSASKLTSPSRRRPRRLITRLRPFEGSQEGPTCSTQPAAPGSRQLSGNW